MILVNGCIAIATGWSSTIPLHNPLDVINCVREWIANPPVKTEGGITFSTISNIKPWYRGFTGSIEEDEGQDGKYITSGVISRTDKKNPTVTISEIPIGMSIQTCLENLNHLTHEEKSIKEFKDYSDADTPKFELKEFPDGMKCNLKNLKLVSTIATSNMVMFDANGKIKKYDSVHDILVEFCETRIIYYEKRKQALLRNLLRKILILKNKRRFLIDVMDKVIIIFRKKEDVLSKELEEMGYEKEMTKGGNDDDEESVDKGYNYLLRLSVRFFTDEKFGELSVDITKAENEYAFVESVGCKDMWLKDLQELEDTYDVWLKEMGKKKGKSKLV